MKLKESTFVKGSKQKLVTTRTASAQSQHPHNRQGIMEKVLTIPGAAEMVRFFFCLAFFFRFFVYFWRVLLLRCFALIVCLA